MKVNQREELAARRRLIEAANVKLCEDVDQWNRANPDEGPIVAEPIDLVSIATPGGAAPECRGSHSGGRACKPVRSVCGEAVRP